MKPFSSSHAWIAAGAAVIWALALPLLLAVPLPLSGAPQAAKTYRIGYLGVRAPPGSDRSPQNCPVPGDANWQAIVEGLRERGYVEGRNLVIECRYTDGREERALPLATELLGLQPDLLVVFSTTNVRAAKQATATVPIVMYGVLDPAGRGLVASLARPGGNVTGLADDAGRQIASKYLQLLKEAVPRVTRVATLGYDTRPHEPMFGADLEAAASALHVALQTYEVREPDQLDGAFAAMTKARAEALIVLPHPFLWDNAQRIVDLAARSGLPAMYPGREFVAEGGLLAYDVDQPAIRRRIGYYVDRILRGAKPADLPVERPTKFDLTINLGTAKALGLTIPPSLVAQANAVIRP